MRAPLDVQPPPRRRSSATRVVVAGCGGGEGASTVAALVAALLSDDGAAPRPVVARVEDFVAARSGIDSEPYADPAVPLSGAVADVGPHGADDTARAGDVLVLVCVATTGAIERAKGMLAEADRGGRPVVALVVTARSVREERRGTVRAMQATRSDARVVWLPFDPVLAGGGPVDPGRTAAATRDAGRGILSLLADRGGVASAFAERERPATD